MDEESRSRRHEHWELVVVLVPEGARDDVLGEVEALMAPYEGGVTVAITGRNPNLRCMGSIGERQTLAHV